MYNNYVANGNPSVLVSFGCPHHGYIKNWTFYKESGVTVSITSTFFQDHLTGDTRYVNFSPPALDETSIAFGHKTDAILFGELQYYVPPMPGVNQSKYLASELSGLVLTQGFIYLAPSGRKWFMRLEWAPVFASAGQQIDPGVTFQWRVYITAHRWFGYFNVTPTTADAVIGPTLLNVTATWNDALYANNINQPEVSFATARFENPSIYMTDVPGRGWDVSPTGDKLILNATVKPRVSEPEDTRYRVATGVIRSWLVTFSEPLSGAVPTAIITDLFTESQCLEVSGSQIFRLLPTFNETVATGVPGTSTYTQETTSTYLGTDEILKQTTEYFRMKLLVCFSKTGSVVDYEYIYTNYYDDFSNSYDLRNYSLSLVNWVGHVYSRRSSVTNVVDIKSYTIKRNGTAVYSRTDDDSVTGSNLETIYLDGQFVHPQFGSLSLDDGTSSDAISRTLRTRWGTFSQNYTCDIVMINGSPQSTCPPSDGIPYSGAPTGYVYPGATRRVGAVNNKCVALKTFKQGVFGNEWNTYWFYTIVTPESAMTNLLLPDSEIVWPNIAWNPRTNQVIYGATPVAWV